MRVLSINSINFYNNFNTATRNRTNASLSFGKDVELQERQNKLIMDVMQEIKKQNGTITANMIAQKTCIPISTVYYRIYNNLELSALFNELKSNAIPSEQQVQMTEMPIAMPVIQHEYSPDTITTYEKKMQEIKWQKEDILRVLQVVKEKGVKISIPQIAQLTGIKEYIVQVRISANDELHTLFREVMQGKISKRADIAKSPKDKMKMLAEAITIAYENEKNGQSLEPQQEQRVKSQTNSTLLNESNEETTQTQAQNEIDKKNYEFYNKSRKQKVIKMILDAKRNGRQISYNTIYSATGATKEEVDSIIQEYKKQKQEYEKQLAIENAKALEAVAQQDKKREEFYKRYVKEDTQKPPQIVKTEPKAEQSLDVTDIQYQMIGVMLKRAQDNGYRISLSTIAKNLHLDEKTAYRAIKSKPALLKIWQEVKAPELINTKQDND